MSKDKIFFDRLRFYAYHGIFRHEELRGQHFELDLELCCDLSRAGQSGLLQDSIDYGQLYQLVKTIIRGRRFPILEQLGSCICTEILQQFPVATEVILRLRKPEAPLEGGLIPDEELGQGGGIIAKRNCASQLREGSSTALPDKLPNWNSGFFGPGGSVGIELRRRRESTDESSP